MNSVVTSEWSENKTILIVDDEESIRVTLSQVLEDEGFSTLTAGDGKIALDIIRNKQPDLVILDIWMPEMDGIEVLRQIKAIDVDIPVLMISGHASIATAIESSRLGAADFIEKPFDLENVLEAVQRFLGISEAQEASENTQKGEEPEPKDKVTSLEQYSNRKRVVRGGPRITPTVFENQLWPGNLVPQRTLKSSAILYGQCLHSGKKSGLILEPLPANHGIHFAGVADTEAVPAHVEYVRSTGFATTLRLGSMRAGTVEHLLSAFHAYGISNALIKCNDEVPVMDGSAKEFCELIDQIGLEDQEGAWYEIAVPHTIRVGSDTEWIQIEPADNFSIDYTLSYPLPVGTQQLSYQLTTAEDYHAVIAPARTFGLLKDVGYLQKQGLAQGGRFDNFILVGDQGPLNVTLRFPDEFVRHKILDAIGDLYLLGRKLRGKVTARLTGHSDNVKLLLAIQDEMKRLG
jgi:UDP-3-O-[3-hydroxymyristoyl] N-acetylglucosamine deacetylase